MSVTSVNQDVFASRRTGMSLTATAEEADKSSRSMENYNQIITDIYQSNISKWIKCTVGVDQVTPNANGEFSTEFNVSNWKQDGMYKIKANQGTSLLYSITLSVDVTSGMTAETSTGEF